MCVVGHFITEYQYWPISFLNQIIATIIKKKLNKGKKGLNNISETFIHWGRRLKKCLTYEVEFLNQFWGKFTLSLNR